MSINPTIEVIKSDLPADNKVYRVSTQSGKYMGIIVRNKAEQMITYDVCDNAPKMYADCLQEFTQCLADKMGLKFVTPDVFCEE